MAEHEKEIQIRSLSGESTTISIPSSHSIQDVKLLLKLIFTPAKISPSFHLFFKGIKMNLASSISSYTIGEEDFIVVVPFTKKAINNDKPPQFSSKPSNLQKASTSAAADAVWIDLTQDASSFSKRIQNEENNGPESVAYSSNIDGRGEMQDRVMDDVMDSFERLKSKNGNVLDETEYEKIARVSDSVNCMCDTKTGKCLTSVLLGMDNEKLCLCPSWLKKLLKIFSFLNIFAGFLQMQRLDVTWDRVKNAMKNLGAFGVEISVEDVRHLSSICPEIVRIVDHEREPLKSGDAIIITHSFDAGGQPDPENYIWTGGKHASSSSVVNAIKKREIKFKGNLWSAVGISMRKRKSRYMTKMMPSLEDLLALMKDSDSTARCGETKHARANNCAASHTQSRKICCHNTNPLSPAEMVNNCDSTARCGETKHARANNCSASHTQSRKRRCHNTNPLLPAEMVEHLRKGIGSRGQIVHVEEIGARIAVRADIPKQLSESTRSALKRIGVSKLYSHQAESIQASLSGENVIVATMTSSGKSLCYNVPVFESLSQNLCSSALYLFPTKALAQDQLRALSEMTKGMDTNFSIGVYDGDTLQVDRMQLRNNARLLITNPDMLHTSILPVHSQFRRILSELRFIVIDEAHTYKGAFGCHTAFILRRLRRLCSHVYGSDPTFIFCTATSANPREHAMELAGLPDLDLIQNDGSPSGPKLFVLWNIFSPSADSSSSPLSEISHLFAEMVQHGLRCITFCKTRNLCELVLSYTREILQETAPWLVDSICSYRAGYMAQERRRIESEFFSGKLRGVAATNALELGIDVGCIDATLHLGFPGSVSSLWQQAGRSGRRERPSLAVYIAFEGPLDQYFMKFPQKLFRHPIECCLVDTKNKQVLEQHLVCAAVEHPLSLLHDEGYFGPGLNSSITTLVRKGYLSSLCCNSSAKIWSYVGHEKRPSYGIGIRAIETEKYKVIDKKKDKVIEEIEESKAFFQVYEGAVYMQQGKAYLVTNLDVFEKIAICEQADLKYYTKTRDHTDIDVGSDVVYPLGQYSKTAQAKSCKITTTWFGFIQIARGSNAILDIKPLSLPEYSYESQAVWIRVPESIIATVTGHNFPIEEGLHAAGHAVLNVVPLFIQCNSSDLASECAIPHGKCEAPARRIVPHRILLYDKHPGGSGVSVQVRPRFRELLFAALELVTSCCCHEATGCPSCIQVLSCREYNMFLHKNAAIMILKGVIEFMEDV